MLGKTNISALQEGAIVEDIADYRWIEQQAGINGNFVQAVFKNNYLIGITTNGNIVYSTDGELWQKSIPEYNDIKLNDVEWDGTRFLISGSYKEGGIEKALLLSTADFSDYEKIDITALFPNTITNASELLYVYPENGKYILVAKDAGVTNEIMNIALHKLYGDLKSTFVHTRIKNGTGDYAVRFAKNSSRSTISFSVSNYEYRFEITGDRVREIKEISGGNGTFVGSGTTFECKDIFYFFNKAALSKRELLKYIDESNEIILSTGINWSFTDAVYYDECELFINQHNMLIVRKGENISEKTLDDMIEIAPEKSIVCIEKAFGRLYIFGNQGVILKSTNEVNNEEGILVQHLSAQQALAESKRYTDEQIAALAARVKALEEA